MSHWGMLRPARAPRGVLEEERGRVLGAGKVVRLRMNPKPKGDVSRKARLVIRGNTRRGCWAVGHAGSSVAEAEQARALAPCDAGAAFGQSEKFGPEEAPEYVAHKPHIAKEAGGNRASFQPVWHGGC